jgi:hypothetical protein
LPITNLFGPPSTSITRKRKCALRPPFGVFILSAAALQPVSAFRSDCIDVSGQEREQ